MSKFVLLDNHCTRARFEFKKEAFISHGIGNNVGNNIHVGYLYSVYTTTAVTVITITLFTCKSLSKKASDSCCNCGKILSSLPAVYFYALLQWVFGLQFMLLWVTHCSNSCEVVGSNPISNRNIKCSVCLLTPDSFKCEMFTGYFPITLK